MTKVTILGQEPTQEKKLKPIELNLVLKNDLEIGLNIFKRKESHKMANIILLCKDYHESGYDLMFGWDGESSLNRGIGCTLFLGHFNDGVVEQWK